jgi:putative ABC exporter
MPGALPVIVRAELLGARNRLVKRNPARLVILAITLVVAGVFLGGGSFAIGATAGHFLPFALDPLLAAGFTALSVLMLVVGFPTVISSLFVGRDLLQLVVAPVRTRDIFAARLMTAVTANLLLSFILAAGVLGVGAGAGAPWFYYPMALLLIAIQVLVVTALQAILMTVILQWVPAKLARDVAAGVAGLTGAALYLAWNLNLRKTFAGRKGGAPDVSNLTSFFQRIDWLPTTWPGHALSATLQGSIGTSLIWMLATLALGALLVAAAELLYERTLLFGLGVFGTPTTVWRRRKPRPFTVVSPPTAGALQARAEVPTWWGAQGSPYRAIAIKDWLGFRRDVRRLTRLLPALLLPLGYAAALSQPARTLSGFWSNVALVTFLSMFLSSALASTSIPTERRGFQLLRLAPLTMWQLLRAKVFIALPPVLATILVFSVAIAVTSKSGAIQLLELLIFGVWLAAGFVSISVSGGAIDPHFEATDDRRSVGIVGTLTSIGGSLGFAVISIGALALFLFGEQAAAGTANLGPIPSTPAVGFAMILGGVLLLVAGCALVAILLTFANARLRAFDASISET